MPQETYKWDKTQDIGGNLADGFSYMECNGSNYNVVEVLVPEGKFFEKLRAGKCGTTKDGEFWLWGARVIPSKRESLKFIGEHLDVVLSNVPLS